MIRAEFYRIRALINILFSIWPEVVNDQLQAAVAAELIDIKLIGKLNFANAVIRPKGSINIERDTVQQWAAADRFNHHLQMTLTDQPLLQGEVVSDGPLTAAEMSMEVAQMLRDAGPWGQMFPEPLFDGRFRLLQQRLVGERHLKVMVEPVDGGPLLDGIAFNVDTSIWPDNGVREVQLAYKLDINEFRGNRSLQLIIDHLWPN